MGKSLFEYRVIIPYSEPTYEMRMGSRLRFPYLAQYQVTAENEKAAKEEALRLFEQDARNSSVGWIRIPYAKKIKVELLYEGWTYRKVAKVVHLKTNKPINKKRKVKRKKDFSILVVDDEFAPREYLRMILKNEGYNATPAEGGIEALDMLAKKSFDLVTTCILMPGMNGLELLSKIKELYPDITVIIITAYSSLETAKSALSLGAFDYLTKPVDKDDFLKTVEAALKFRKSLKS